MSPTRVPRVRLRELRPEDEDEFLEHVRGSRSLHRPWAHPPETSKGFRDLLDGAANPSEALFLIVREQDGAMAGYARLSQIVLGGFRNAYLGYSAFAGFDGRGYMTDGLQLVLREAFGPIGLHRVEANVQPDNVRSIALVERLGFRREGYSPRYLKIGGRWRDHVRFAILAEDFFTAETGTQSSFLSRSSMIAVPAS